MRGIQIPAAAPRLAPVLIATTVVVGCGAAQRPSQAAATVAATAAKPAGHTSASKRAAAILAPSGIRLAAIAFTSSAAGYGIFTGRAGGRCQALAARTTDGGTRRAGQGHRLAVRQLRTRLHPDRGQP